MKNGGNIYYLCKKQKYCGEDFQTSLCLELYLIRNKPFKANSGIQEFFTERFEFSLDKVFFI